MNQPTSTNLKLDPEVRGRLAGFAARTRRTLTASANMLLTEALDVDREAGEADRLQARQVEWASAAHCTVEPEPDATSFAGSPPHALFFRNAPRGYVLAVEGTVDELRAFAAQVTAAAAGLGAAEAANRQAQS